MKFCLEAMGWPRTCYYISYRRQPRTSLIITRNLTNLISLLLYKVFHTMIDDKRYCLYILLR